MSTSPHKATTLGLQNLLTRPPRIVRDSVLDYIDDSGADYCGNFGVQWRRFGELQIDSISRRPESRARFFAETGWRPEELAGKLLLDAGCGAGRFAEVAVECGARVVAMDISEAAYTCRRTLEAHRSGKWLVLRADLFDLPLAERAFDGIFALGVLQHTPDPLGAIGCLARLLAPGGRLATWIYERHSLLLEWLQPRTWIRALTAGWSAPSKLALARALAGAFFPLGWALSWTGRPGELASRLLPYAARHHLGRGDLRRQWDYAVMDTFDWYGPVYDQPQTEQDVTAAMRAAGLVRVRRLPARGMAIVGEAAGAGGA